MEKHRRGSGAPPNGVLRGSTMTRRSLLSKGVALGLGLSTASAVLSACGSEDSEGGDTDGPASTASADDVQPTPATDGEEEPTLEATQPDEREDPASGDVTPAESDDMAYGFNIAWRPDDQGEQFNTRTREAVTAAGFNWVRFQVHWREVQREPDWFDPAPLDRVLAIYEGSEIGVLVSVVGAPEWALDASGEQLLQDYQSFTDFMEFMAGRYQGQVHAWEIWNEQNMAHEMQGTVRVGDYAALLEAGYHGVTDADPDALVVFGGLTPTGVNDPEIAINDVEYLESFYRLEEGHYAQFFDVLGMHLNATNNPPDTSYPDNPGPGDWSDHNSFYFLRGRDQREVMEQFDDDRPVWVTEFGWTTENMAEGYEYGSDVSEEDQANYLTAAFDVAREQMPWIEGMFVWNLNFATLTPAEDEKHPWSVLDDEWSPRPAYQALQEMPKP